MRNSSRLIDILDRMETGQIMEENDFDKLIAKRCKALVKEYEIRFDGSSLVNCDDAMADRCFQAGLQLASEAGVYCRSNNRRLTWSRREILDVLKSAPGELLVGAGHDQHLECRREVEDSRPPTMMGGPVGQPLPEHLFLPIMQSYIQEPLVDMVVDGTLQSVYGREPRTRSPWEILAGWHEAELALAAARRAGREGISLGCVECSCSDLPELSATSYGGFRPTDWHQIAMISELKTDYGLLNKVTHLVRTDSIIHTFANPIYGGLAGGAEGLAVILVSGMILLQMAYMTTTHSQCPHIPSSCATRRPRSSGP